MINLKIMPVLRFLLEPFRLLGYLLGYLGYLGYFFILFY